MGAGDAQQAGILVSYSLIGPGAALSTRTSHCGGNVVCRCLQKPLSTGGCRALGISVSEKPDFKFHFILIS